jgi:hypothetical protein
MKKEIMINDALWLEQLSKELREAKQYGTPVDDPEGSCWIQISSTLRDELVSRVLLIAASIRDACAD